MNNEIVQVLIENVMQIAATVLIVLINVFGAWIGKKLAKNTELKNIEAATNELAKAVERTVRELQQTVVADLKASSADGKLTHEEILDLNDKLIEYTVGSLSNPTIGLLNGAGIDVNAMILSYGESIIQKIHEAN